jgi:hypothetical protein
MYPLTREVAEEKDSGIFSGLQDPAVDVIDRADL